MTSTGKQDVTALSPSPVGGEEWHSGPSVTSLHTMLPTSTPSYDDSGTSFQATTPPQDGVEASHHWTQEATISSTAIYQDPGVVLSTPPPIYKPQSDFTTRQETGGSALFTSSVVTATVSGIITGAETEGTTTTKSSWSAYDDFKLGLIISLSVVIGCFAITAISLRIRSRIKKRRLESETVKKRKKSTGNNSKPPVRTVTIKMSKDSSSGSRKGNGESRRKRRSHSPSLQSKAKLPKVHFADSMDRNRTLDALLDAGVYPVAATPLGSTHGRTKSDVSSGTLLVGGRKEHAANEHAYENPAISSAEDLPTEVSTLSEEVCLPMLKINADVHGGHGQFITNARHAGASDSDEGSAEKMSNFIENSETESLSEGRRRYRLNHSLGMRSNQRNDSRDSGYVESFISQDSLRLRAMACVEEGRALSDGSSLTLGPERMMPRFGTVDSGMFMASVDETSPHDMSLNRSSSVKSDNDRFSHPRGWHESNISAARRSRYSVPSFPTQLPHSYYQRNNRPAVSLGPYHDMYGIPYVSYQANMQRYPSSESSMYDYPTAQGSELKGSTQRKFSNGTRTMPKSQSWEATGYRNQDYASPARESQIIHDYASPRDALITQDLARKKRAKRFVKHRSLGTQTDHAHGDDHDDAHAQPTVRWEYNSTGNLVVKPRENAGVDFIGPIYMAEELDKLGNSFHESDFVIDIAT